MITHGLDLQIKALAEQGLSPADIAGALNLDQKSVELALYSQGAIDFGEDACKDAAAIIAGIMRDDNTQTHLRLDAAKFVIEVGRGHRVPKTERPQLNISLIQNTILQSNNAINERLFGSRSGGARANSLSPGSKPSGTSDTGAPSIAGGIDAQQIESGGGAHESEPNPSAGASHELVLAAQ